MQDMVKNGMAEITDFNMVNLPTIINQRPFQLSNFLPHFLMVLDQSPPLMGLVNNGIPRYIEGRHSILNPNIVVNLHCTLLPVLKK